MTLPLPAGQGGLRFRVLGFPVRLQPWFLLVLALLGLGPGATVASVAVWVAVAGVSVLVHEMGHAVAARAYGHTAEITLYGFGGVTSHSGRSLSRGQGAIVSVAGPFAGVTLGLVVLVLDRAGALPTSGLGEDAVAAALWANLGWSVLNLMPVVPLDGGHLVAAALPGSRALRERRAAAVSVVAAVALGAVAVAYGAIFAGVVAGWFALGNVATLRQPKARPPDEIGRAVLALVDAGDPAKAWHLLSTVPGGSEVDPAIVALVVASNGNLDTGLAVARRVAAEAPADAQRAALLARIERLHEEGRTEA